MKYDELNKILDEGLIKSVFQPIISLREGNVLGYEALSRIQGDSKIKNIEKLFCAAEEQKQLWELELLCRTKALESAYEFLNPLHKKKLFLNVNPNIMHDEKFKKGFTKKLLENYNIASNEIVFEITERNVVEDMSGFKTTVNNYKSQEYKIAIDDAGSGYSGLNLISEVNPNYIKLDMFLTRNVDKNRLKFALIKGMVEFSKVSNIHLIAEGIETVEELEALISLGVEYGQGYYIQKPDYKIKDIDPEILETIKTINQRNINVSRSIISNFHVKDLCIPISKVGVEEFAVDVYETFKQNPDDLGVCVIENGFPVGIVTFEKLAIQMSGNYGFCLNMKSNISKLMDRDFLSVDYNTPVNLVSSMAMLRTNKKLYDFIVVTKDGKCIGVVTVKDLLQKTTEMKVTVAKHQNPLTGLAGNLMIEQKLDDCIRKHSEYTVAYFDIDNFKAYNDVYGIENGDLVIKLLADILRSFDSCGHFIGHVGGDDFVVIVNTNVSNEYFHEIKNEFELEVLKHYTQKDIKNGYITSANRRGKKEKFPLSTVTCVTTNSQENIFENVYELTETLAMLKKLAKQKK